MKILSAALLLSIGMATAATAAVTVRGEDNNFVDDGVYWADNTPVRIKIDPAVNGSIVTAGEAFSFNVYYDNFAYEPDEATNLGAGQYANGKKRSNAGHIHLYGTFLGDNSNDPTDPNFWNYTNVFVGASNNEVAPGVLEYTIILPEAGLWMINSESQYDDHTPRTRHHPQQIGAWDVVQLTAVEAPIPEPSSLALLAAGAFLVTRRRRN